MEEVTYATKRKKRKTRRCLDEIRNRLRRKCGNSFEISIQDTKSFYLQSKKSENRLVTMDRLTLKAMFPNAIRSKTITRPILEEINQKRKFNFVDVLTDNDIKKAALPLKHKLTNNNLNNVTFTDHRENSTCEDNNCKNNGEVKSSNSFSPAVSIHRASALNKSVQEDAVTSSTPSSQATNNVRHQRYEELMDEIPSYIRHLASSYSKEETISKLYKLYMESCQKESEQNVRSNGGQVLTTNKAFYIEHQPIVENPMDYIRLEQERQQNRGSPLLSLSDSLSPGNDTVLSPTSPHASPPEFHIDLVPYDTPDYNYYPHRLK